MNGNQNLIEEARRPHCKECDHFVKALADALEAAEKERRAVKAEAWFAGYDKGNLDGYFGTRDGRRDSPYADLDPYRQEKSDD